MSICVQVALDLFFWFHDLWQTLNLLVPIYRCILGETEVLREI